MRICRFVTPADPSPRLGLVKDDEVVDLRAGEPNLPADPTNLLDADGRAELAAAAERSATRVPLSDITLLAPIPRPPKFLAIGLNYMDHVNETGREPPAHQLWFNKQSTSVVGPGAPIHVPRVSAWVDYEGELGFVISRRCRHVPAGRAREVVGGYLVVNDVSVRDWQARTPTMTMGKSFDTHGPCGPWIVTVDEIEDPQDLRLRTWVSGELRQDASTKEMVFGVDQQVEHLSTAFTLEPGDLVSTGTPSGVGAAAKPPRWLVPGDSVRIEVEGVGALENPVIAEPEDTGRI